MWRRQVGCRATDSQGRPWPRGAWALHSGGGVPRDFPSVGDGWTEALLLLDEWPPTKFGHLRHGSSWSHVILQGPVIGRVRCWYEMMPGDLGPGKLSQRPMAWLILEGPSIL